MNEKRGWEGLDAHERGVELSQDPVALQDHPTNPRGFTGLLMEEAELEARTSLSQDPEDHPPCPDCGPPKLNGIRCWGCPYEEANTED